MDQRIPSSGPAQPPWSGPAERPFTPHELEHPAQPWYPPASAPPPQPARANRHQVTQGHIVLIVAKWMLIVAGLALTLWAPEDLRDLKIQLLVLVLLALQNFYYHAQILMKRPVPDAVAYGSSISDLAVVTVLVAMGGRIDSGLFVFYLPALAAIALVFSQEATIFFTAAAVAVYAAIGAGSMDAGELAEADAQKMVVRMLMMVAIAVCGSTFARIEAERRRKSLPFEATANSDFSNPRV